MTDKITTLKTKTGYNVYPNINGDNRKDSFADSSTIKHYFYEQTHKVGFQLANETNNKIINALQKPAGLTKTELVGVGTNGQENIEIGDNLTLANGKLNASGGGGSDVSVLEFDNNQEHFTGDIDLNKVNIIKNGSSSTYIINETFDFGIAKLGALLIPNLSDEGYPDGNILLYSFVKSGSNTNVVNTLIHTRYYSHFLTLTYSSNNAVLYLTIQNTSEEQFTSATLASYLAGKKVLANGNLNGNVPTYIAGEGGSIKMYYRTAGDSNINPEPDVYSDLSSFAISDLVTPVE